MVCLFRALAAVLGTSVVAAASPNIHNANIPVNNLFPSPASALHQAQAPADATKSHTPNSLKTDHVLRDAPAMTDTQSSTQTGTDAAAATAKLVRYVHHHHNNCTAMCRGYCKKPDHAKDKIDLGTSHQECPECDCSKFKSSSVRTATAMGALKTAGIAVVGLAGVMTFL